MKKGLSLLMVVMMAATLFSGCGAKETTTATETASTETATEVVAETEEPAAEAAASDVTLTYMASQDHIKDSEYALIDKFTAETGIKVDVQIVPADQMDTLLTTKLNTGEAPDIFMGQSGALDLVSKYDVEKNCADLSGEEWVSREWELTRSTATYNGKLYGMTVWDMAASFMVVYNKTIFADLGIEVPKTYADFKAACDKIAASGVTPIYEPVSDGWHHVLWVPQIGGRMEQLEPGLYDKLNKNEMTLSESTSYVTAITQLKEMVDAGYFGENYLSDAYSETEKVMAEGTYAMTLYNLALPAQIAAAYPDQDINNFGFFPIPLLDNTVVPMDGGAPTKYIFSGSEHIAEAKELFSFLARPESLQYMIDEEAEFNSVCWDGVKSTLTDEQNTLFANYPDKAVVLQNGVSYYNPQWMDIGKDLSALFLDAATVEETIKQADLRRTDSAKVNKDANWQ